MIYDHKIILSGYLCEFILKNRRKSTEFKFTDKKLNYIYMLNGETTKIKRSDIVANSLKRMIVDQNLTRLSRKFQCKEF